MRQFSKYSEGDLCLDIPKQPDISLTQCYNSRSYATHINEILISVQSALYKCRWKNVHNDTVSDRKYKAVYNSLLNNDVASNLKLTMNRFSKKDSHTQHFPDGCQSL